MNVNLAPRIRHQAEADERGARERREMADAYIGLDGVLKGAWGSQNVRALGGGAAQIEKAHRVLGRELERISPS